MAKAGAKNKMRVVNPFIVFLLTVAIFMILEVTISPSVITTSMMMDAICVDRTFTRDRGIPIFTAIGFRMAVTMSGI